MKLHYPKAKIKFTIVVQKEKILSCIEQMVAPINLSMYIQDIPNDKQAYLVI